MLFGNKAVPLHVWPVLLVGGLVFFLAIEIKKRIIRSSMESASTPATAARCHRH